MSPIQDQLNELKFEVKNIKNGLNALGEELRRIRDSILEMVKTLHNEQINQLQACQEAFKMNVNRDEELMDALAESQDPWSC